MKYLVVSASEKVLTYVEETCRAIGHLPGGVLVETVDSHSVTDIIFRKTLDANKGEKFSVFRVADIRPFGRLQETVDACSTEWLEKD